MVDATTPPHAPLSRRTLALCAVAWGLFAFLQSPGLISADTKLDLTADPWGFLRQALYPWTDTFPLGQLQNQAYGYLFPHGLFFALLSWLPAWIVQRLWWTLLLWLAFAGTVRLLEAAGDRGIGSRSSRVIAGILFALSPRILTTLGAISSEAWVCALVPWVLLFVVRAVSAGSYSGRHSSAGGAGSATSATGAGSATGASAREPGGRLPKRYLATQGLLGGVAILCLGAVNAVATAVAVIPAALFWLSAVVGFGAGSSGASSAAGAAGSRRAAVLRAAQRRRALYFGMWWIPAGVLATFWWIGPLILLGKYSPPFTDYIESASLTTRWLNPMEVLRGATSWTPFISAERPAGNALVTEPVFIVATLIVALIGLWGLSRPGLAFAGRWLLILLVGMSAMIVAVAPFSPIAEPVREFLDGAGAPLRNLHKFDPVVRIALVVGIAHGLRSLQWPGRSRNKWVAWRNPEKNPQVVKAIAVSLLLAVATAPGWSGQLPAADAYRGVPRYWIEAARWLNEHAQASPGHVTPRTMILPEARFARQTWGNTRDEPAQPLLDVPWVVRDSVPLVQPEAIRALDGVQQQLNTGVAIPSLSGTLWSQGVGYVLVRRDLTRAADTPGAKQVDKTLQYSGGFTPVATFGGESGQNRDKSGATDEQITIYRVDPTPAPAAGTAGDLRIIDTRNVEVVSAGPEALPRLNSADGALGRTGTPRTRILAGQAPDDAALAPSQTATDTPALREHNYGNVTHADSEIRSSKDPSSLLNPITDYPVRNTSSPDNTPLPASDYTQVVGTGGAVVASSTAASPTSFGGAETYSSATSAVDGSTFTAWRPAPGQAAGQYIEFQLPKAYANLGLELRTQGSLARVQVTTYLRHNDQHPDQIGERIDPSQAQGSVVASTTATVRSGEDNVITVPAGLADTVRVTIVGTFGDFGISSATVISTQGDSTTNVTPHRVPTLPEWPTDPTHPAPNRWVFGQEIPEGVMTREFTVPATVGGGTPERPGELPVVVHTDRCVRGQDARVTIDGVAHPCGEVFTLTAGPHRLEAKDRWVSLTVAEPLYGAAVRETPSAQPLTQSDTQAGTPDGHGEQSTNLAASDQQRILFSPSQANPGRVATLDGTRLTPVTVNGWQQGWIVPAGASGLVTITFAGTHLYRAWLLAGAAAAVLLLLAAALMVFSSRRHPTPSRLPVAAVTTSEPSARRGIRRYAFPVAFGTSSFVLVLLAARGPWGGLSYAGDSWLVAGATGVAVASVVLRSVLRWVPRSRQRASTPFHQELIQRREGSSTSE